MCEREGEGLCLLVKIAALLLDWPEYRPTPRRTATMGWQPMPRKRNLMGAGGGVAAQGQRLSQHLGEEELVAEGIGAERAGEIRGASPGPLGDRHGRRDHLHRG